MRNLTRERLASVLLPLLVAASVGQNWSLLERVRRSPSNQIRDSLQENLMFDAEGTLALGRPLPLAVAQQPDLELIPGLGPQSAEKIFAARERILARGELLPPGQRSRALEVAHGIGSKRSMQLSRWLTVSGSSDVNKLHRQELYGAQDKSRPKKKRSQQTSSAPHSLSVTSKKNARGSKKIHERRSSPQH